MDLSIPQIIERLSRASLVTVLENVCIQCYDSESTEVLREAVRVNVDDGTISGEAISAAWGSQDPEDSETPEEDKYEIIRFFQRGERETVATDVTLEEANEHCNDPESSSKTCTSDEGMERTRTRGDWFDGRQKM